MARGPPWHETPGIQHTLLLFTEFLKKSDSVRKLYFINLGGEMLRIISFEIFSFILYGSI